MLRKDKLHDLQYDIGLKKNGFEFFIKISVVVDDQMVGEKDMIASVNVGRGNLQWFKLTMRQKNGNREFSSSYQWEHANVVALLKGQALNVLKNTLLEGGRDPLSDQITQLGGHVHITNDLSEEDVNFRRLSLNGMVISSKDFLQSYEITDKDKEISQERLKALIIEAKWQLTHLFSSYALDGSEEYSRRRAILFGPMPK